MGYGYKTLIDLDCLDEIPKSGNRKELILKFCRSLSDIHHNDGDFQVFDPLLGHKLEVSVIEGYQVFWWVDHPVKRVVIVKIRKI